MFSYQLHTDSLFLCANFNSSPMTYGGAGIWLSLSLQPRCSDTFIYPHQRNAVVLSATFREFLFTALPVHGPSSPDTCSCCEADGTLRTLRTAWGVFSLLFNTRMATSPTNHLALIQPHVPIRENRLSFDVTYTFMQLHLFAQSHPEALPTPALPSVPVRSLMDN